MTGSSLEPRVEASDRSRTVALVLNILLGVFGAHRFYLGKVGTGVAMLVTLGGMGLWWLYDLVLIVGGEMRDAEGHRLIHWSLEDAATNLSPAQMERVMEELEQLRTEMAELHERVDFTERLLAKGNPRGNRADA